ncbi:MAG TPA: YceH family protein [Bryobacteraceae bacterium]|jgi:hypothetical protein
MDWELDAAEARVLGSLLEKEIATPEYYPLSLNALVNACNQKSNREPVVSYDEDTVEEALAGLRAKGLAVRITGDSRVPKHAQRFTEVLNLGRREAALVCVLLLRGPQTSGELRSRSERLYSFDDIESVESALNRLAEAGLAKKLPRQTGTRESRYAQLLSSDVEAAVQVPQPAVVHSEAKEPLAERVAALEQELANLRQEFDDFRRRFE